MGYSCTAAAMDTLQALMRRHNHGRSSNTFSTDAGKTVYFQEIGREQRDGAVTGTVHKMHSNDTASPAGTFRIEPDGRVSRFPGIPQAFWKAAQQEASQRQRQRPPVFAVHY